MYLLKSIVSVLLVFILASNSFAQKKQIPVALIGEEYEVQFLKDGVEGTILFKIFSYGKNENDCLTNAKRNAIRAVIFDGIPGSDLQNALVTEAGAEEKYKDYFNAFLKPNGKYIKYVAISTDGSIDANDRLRVGNKIKIGIVVLVQKASLRKELETAGVIRKLNDGF